MSIKSFYFGCWERSGHFLFMPTSDGGCREVYSQDEKILPFAYHILDMGLMPQNVSQTEGLARIAYIGGWTVLSFWDRSVDKRGNSTSNFLFGKILNFDDALRIARAGYPRIFSRYTFDIVPDQSAGAPTCAVPKAEVAR